MVNMLLEVMEMQQDWMKQLEETLKYMDIEIMKLQGRVREPE